MCVEEQNRWGGANRKNSIKAVRLFENFYLIMRIRQETGEDCGHDPRTFNQPCFICFPPTRDNPTRLFPPEFLPLKDPSDQQQSSYLDGGEVGFQQVPRRLPRSADAGVNLISLFYSTVFFFPYLNTLLKGEERHGS